MLGFPRRGDIHLPRTPKVLGTVAMLFVLAAMLAGCGNYQGARDEDEQATTLQAPAGVSQAAQVSEFESTLYPVVVQYCGSGCHDSGAQGAPILFAHSDSGTAYQVITSSGVVNFGSAAQSRVVRRPAADFHQCGGACTQIGAEMLTQVEAWIALRDASAGTGTQLQVASIASEEVAFIDGVEQENGERYQGNLIAFYDFSEGTGSIAFDSSGVAPAMDLEVQNAEWMGAYGLVMDDSHLSAEVNDSEKLYDQIAKPGYGTGQYTIELWINNANVTQENARIVAYERHGGDSNVSLYQQEYQYVVRNHSMADGSGSDGRVALITSDVDQDAQETLQHVVITYDAYYGRRVYVDSYFTGDLDPLGGARLWTWNSNAQFFLGSNRSGSEDFWRGQIRMLAIYKQALSQAQIRQNFLVGVGKRVLLEFNVGTWTGTDAKLEFFVTELDSYSYLFCQPTFTGTNLNGIQVKNIRIVVNPGAGVDPSPQGQAFINVDELLTGSQDQVSRNCSIIAKGSGPDTDSFEVEFEELALFIDPITPPVVAYQPSATALALPPEVGFRSFERINRTMAELSGVDPLASREVDPSGVDPIQDTYDGLKQQLPASFDVRSIVSSHQVGVTKLAFEYCVEMVDRADLREAAFGSEFELGAPSFFESDVATAFAMANLPDLMSVRLADHMLGVEQLNEQPLHAEVIAELDLLRDDLVANCEAPCGVDETLSIAKGMCTALLSSAPIMVH